MPEKKIFLNSFTLINVMIAIALLGTALGLIPLSSGYGLVINWYYVVFAFPKSIFLAISILGIAAVLIYNRSSFQFKLSLFDACFLAYILAGVISSVVNQVYWTKAASSIASDLVFFVFYFAISRIFSKESPKTSTITMLMACSAFLLSLLAFAEFLGLYLPWTFIARPVSFLGSRNFVGSYLVAVLPFVALGLRKEKFILSLVLTFLFLVLIVVCRSRSNWLALIAASAFVLPLIFWVAKPLSKSDKVRATWMLVTFCLAVFTSVFVPWSGIKWSEENPYKNSLTRMFEYNQGSGKVRLDQWRVGLDIWNDHRLLGVGPGNWNTFQPIYEMRRTEQLQVNGPFAQSPQSDWLRILSERGLLGIIAFAMFFLGVLYRGTRLIWLRQGDPWIVGTALASLIISMIEMCFTHRLLKPDSLMVLACTTGILFSQKLNTTIFLKRNVNQFFLGFIPISAIFVSVVFALQNIAGYQLWHNRDIAAWHRHLKWWPYPQHVIEMATMALNENKCSEVKSDLIWALAKEPARGELLRLQEQCDSIIEE